MEIRDEIIAKVDQLPASVQEEVLQYVSALNAELPRLPGQAGEPWLGLIARTADARLRNGAAAEPR